MSASTLDIKDYSTFIIAPDNLTKSYLKDLRGAIAKEL